MESKLFVYGTLKRGLGNNSLLRNSEFLGVGITKDRFDVYDCGFPCAFRNSDGKRIKGDIYDLTEVDFSFTDMLESNGSLYQREIREFDFHNEIVKAWIYIIINPFGRLYETTAEIINWKG